LQDASTPAIWLERRERIRQVRNAVQELPAEFREAVVLCELEELSYEEAAQMAGCPIGTIRFAAASRQALLMAKLECFAACRAARVWRDERFFMQRKQEMKCEEFEAIGLDAERTLL